MSLQFAAVALARRNNPAALAAAVEAAAIAALAEHDPARDQAQPDRAPVHTPQGDHQ